MKRFVSIVLTLLMCLLTAMPALAGNDYGGLSERPILRRGASGAEVTELQKALISKGYMDGPADGFYGPGTEDAVAAFQRRNGFSGLPGYAGVATLFTQAVLYGDRAMSAGSMGAISGSAGGQYSLRSGEVRTLGKLSNSLTFYNEDIHTVEALCFIYWLSDSRGRVVSIDSQDYCTFLLSDLNVAPGAAVGINAVLPATEKELNRACSLRFIVAEIAYTNGSVYVDYNAALAPYESDFFEAAKWS